MPDRHFIINLPDGLTDRLSSYNERQVRRRVYVFIGGVLLQRPDFDYRISQVQIEVINFPEGATMTIAVPGDDERWEYDEINGWGRL